MVAPRTFDVGSITREALSRLPPVWARTLEQAKSTWAAFLPRARITLTISTANEGAPTLTLVPPGFDPSKPVTVQTHYHGDATSIAAAAGPHTGNIKEQLLRDPQRVWVLPEAKGKVGLGNTNWNNVKDQAGTTRDALTGAGVTGVTTHVVSAHSSGGRAIAAAMTSGTLQADQLVLLDCLFEREQGPGAHTAILNAVKKGGLSQVKDVVIVATGSYPSERDDQLIAAGGGKVRKEELIPRQGSSDHEAAVRNHLVPT